MDHHRMPTDEVEQARLKRRQGFQSFRAGIYPGRRAACEREMRNGQRSKYFVDSLRGFKH